MPFPREVRIGLISETHDLFLGEDNTLITERTPRAFPRALSEYLIFETAAKLLPAGGKMIVSVPDKVSSHTLHRVIEVDAQYRRPWAGCSDPNYSDQSISQRVVRSRLRKPDYQLSRGFSQTETENEEIFRASFGLYDRLLSQSIVLRRTPVGRLRA